MFSHLLHRWPVFAFFAGTVALSNGATAQTVYWSFHCADQVECPTGPNSDGTARAPLAGNPVEQIPSHVYYERFAVDTNHLHFYGLGHHWGIERRGLDGTFKTQVYDAPNGVALGDIAFDRVNSKLYWMEFETSPDPTFRLQSADVRFTSIETVLSAPFTLGRYDADRVAKFGMDAAGRKLYWALPYDGTLWRLDLDTDSVELLRDDLDREGTVIGVDVDDAKLYWLDRPESDTRAHLYRSDLTGNSKESLGPFNVSTAPYDAFDLDGAHNAIYYGTGTQSLSATVYRFDLDTGTYSSFPLQTTTVTDVNIVSIPQTCSTSSPFGDIAAPYFIGQPDFTDINAVVTCFLGDSTACPNPGLADLFPCYKEFGVSQCVGDGVVDFNDISTGVNAFLGGGCPLISAQ